jgi:hypothetical protein
MYSVCDPPFLGFRMTNFPASTPTPGTTIENMNLNERYKYKKNDSLRRQLCVNCLVNHSRDCNITLSYLKIFVVAALY